MDARVAPANPRVGWPGASKDRRRAWAFSGWDAEAFSETGQAIREHCGAGSVEVRWLCTGGTPGKKHESERRHRYCQIARRLAPDRPQRQPPRCSWVYHLIDGVQHERGGERWNGEKGRPCRQPLRLCGGFASARNRGVPTRVRQTGSPSWTANRGISQHVA